MQELFFRKIQDTLSVERLSVYGMDNDCAVLARYLWNMSVCESLYSPLQIAEVALRNLINTQLSSKYGELWFDNAPISKYQGESIAKARKSLGRSQKTILTGAIVAELNFGFWTSFFNKRHSQTGLGHYLAKSFLYAPKSKRDMKQLEKSWEQVRLLRNRVFHHERIIHWGDLNDKHQLLLNLVSWINPELYEMAVVLDRFKEIYTAGVNPWIDKIHHHWPKTDE